MCNEASASTPSETVCETMVRKGPAMLQLKSSAAGAVLFMSLVLTGCLPHEPLPYSPNYSRVTMVDEPNTPADPRAVHKAKARRPAEATTVGVPDACITPDVTEQ